RRASPAPVAPGSATPASYPLSLHDALPISPAAARLRRESHAAAGGPAPTAQRVAAGSGQPAGRPAGESGGGWTWQILPTDAPVTASPGAYSHRRSASGAAGYHIRRSWRCPLRQVEAASSNGRRQL